MMSDTTLFLIYPPRSGSTLLQIMLSQHPGIAISPEVRFARRVLKRFDDPTAELTGADLDQLKAIIQQDDKLAGWKIDSQPFIAGIMAAESLSPRAALDALFRFNRDVTASGAPVIGLKKGNLIPIIDKVAAAWPDARFLFAYRDGRACVASMVKNLAFDEYQTAAWRWKHRVHYALNLRDREPDRFHMVCYEDLIADTEAVLRGICSYLGLDFDPRMLEHHRANRDLQFVPKGREAAHRNTSEPVSGRFADRWREQLSAEEVQAIEAIIGPELLRLGYTPDFPLPEKRKGRGLFRRGQE